MWGKLTPGCSETGSAEIRMWGAKLELLGLEILNRDSKGNSQDACSISKVY